MRLGIIGAIALGLGVWAMVAWWWFVVEIVQALVALALVNGGLLALIVAARRMYRAQKTGE
ncbi:MAG: hypothetical protein GY774_02730 [Planctomycetes bacterium]|nr:hypothetical protein [Planctomycetota bacterium]